MDDTFNRLARELAQAIADAVASDPNVEACRARARAAGFEMHVSLEAEIGFASRTKTAALVRSKKSTPALQKRDRELTASDRLFLKSLRIAPDEIPEVKG